MKKMIIMNLIEFVPLLCIVFLSKDSYVMFSAEWWLFYISLAVYGVLSFIEGKIVK